MLAHFMRAVYYLSMPEQSLAQVHRRGIHYASLGLLMVGIAIAVLVKYPDHPPGFPYAPWGLAFFFFRRMAECWSHEQRLLDLQLVLAVSRDCSQAQEWLDVLYSQAARSRFERLLRWWKKFNKP
jgi:hypothetical protein